MKTPQREALERAIELSDGITAFARALNLNSHRVVQQWRITRVPAERCPAIEALTGVKCEELRPDVPWGILRSSSSELATTPAANDTDPAQAAEQEAPHA